MTLTDDERAAISLQVAALAGEYKDAIASLKEAKADVMADLAARASEQQGVLRELALWRVVCRYGFALILGSSLFGLLYIRRYVSDIAQQQLQTYTNRTDQIVFGVTAGVKEDWVSALNQFSVAWRSMSSSASGESRKYTMLNLLWALGNIEQKATDGSWMGTDDWRDLSTNDYFKRTLTADHGWTQDGDINLNVAMAILKFDRAGDFVDRSMRYLRAAAEYRVPEERKGEVHYYLAVLALIKRDDALARDEIGKAATLNPRGFALSKLVDEHEPFFSPSGLDFWRSIGEAAHYDAFDIRLTRFFYQDLRASSDRND